MKEVMEGKMDGKRGPGRRLVNVDYLLRRNGTGT